MRARSSMLNAKTRPLAAAAAAVEEEVPAAAAADRHTVACVLEVAAQASILRQRGGARASLRALKKRAAHSSPEYVRCLSGYAAACCLASPLSAASMVEDAGSCRCLLIPHRRGRGAGGHLSHCLAIHRGCWRRAALPCAVPRVQAVEWTRGSPPGHQKRADQRPRLSRWLVP